jgi:hypothetical protein
MDLARHIPPEKSAPSQAEKSSMPSSTTMPPASSPTSSNGWPIIHAGCSISHRPASWLNAVEGFFSAITRRQIRRGAFHSVDDLQNAIKRYIDARTAIVDRSYGPLPPKQSS